MVHSVVLPEVICLSIALGTGALRRDDVPTVAATERATTEVAAHFRTWLADPSAAGAEAIRERVALGAPPDALVVLLEGMRESPRPDLADIAQGLAGYRRADIRGHAIAAWAELGGAQAERAIAAAATDLDPGIRTLAPALASRHPSERAAQIVVDLLARDADLAAVLEEDAPVIESDAPVVDDDAVVIVEDAP